MISETVHDRRLVTLFLTLIRSRCHPIRIRNYESSAEPPSGENALTYSYNYTLIMAFLLLLLFGMVCASDTIFVINK